MENHLLPDDGIPKAIIDALPSDPFELLNISRFIAARAFAVRAQQAEQETSRAVEASRNSLKLLEAKVAALEESLQEAKEKAQKSEQDQARLTNEKTALVAMVKKLNRDVAKLETFKRTLMQQLQDENEDEPPSALAGLDSSTSKSAAPAATAPAAAAGTNSGGSSSSASRLHGDSTSDADSTAPHAAAAAPDATAADATAGDSAAGAIPVSPLMSAAAAPQQGPPPMMSNKIRTPLMTPSLVSPQYTPSATPPHSASSANSARDGRPPRVDGKEFFRQARNRLSYEQFSAFLANIKELNAHRQTREETLRKADEIFGPENKDLYGAFDGLLSRHLPS